jgi:hypothetical protein
MSKALSTDLTTLTGKLSGSVSIDTVSETEVVSLLKGDNLVVSSAQDVIVGLLKREFASFAPHYIVIGDGGDLEQVAKVDSGARVAADITDTEVRRVIARIPIVQVEATSSTSWTYVAVAGKNDAVTPVINELGLESFNNTLISHYITPVNDDGRASTYPKVQGEFLVIRWTLEFNLI